MIRSFLILSLLFSFLLQAQTPHPFNIVKEQLRIPMRDGVHLGATFYRPQQEAKFPALVYRTPYSKDSYDARSEFPLKAAKSGYLIYLVDVRGRYTSEGNFEAYRNEKLDGFDVIEWVAKSPHSNGKVGTFGISYPGYVQWLALSQSPPSLKTAVPVMTPIHSHQFFYVGGAFTYSWFDWFVINILPDLRRKAGDRTGPWEKEDAEDQWRQEKMKWYGFRPLSENPLLKKYAPYYYDWMRHPEKSDYWNFANVDEDFGKMKAPVLLIGGWYDSVYGTLGATEAFNRMRKSGGSPEARQQTRLILGPWDHGSMTLRETGLGLFENGPSAGMDYDTCLLQWFDKHLQGKEDAQVFLPVSLFVMGANIWRFENEWPLTRAIETSLYLRNNGSLQKHLPGNEDPDRFVFDPENPVWDPAYLQFYPFDQKEIEDREDVLVYTSDRLTEDMEVTGQIAAELFVSSSAKDTDFAITFCDVFPDGTSVNLTGLDAGYLRMRYRNGFDKMELMQPGKIYRIRIDNLYTSNLFRKGHRIRLQITSSKAPHYDPNPNTGTDLATERNLQKATQTIYHEQKFPSRLILPVIR